MSSWSLQSAMVLVIRPKGVHISICLLLLLLPEPILSACEEWEPASKLHMPPPKRTHTRAHTNCEIDFKISPSCRVNPNLTQVLLKHVKPILVIITKSFVASKMLFQAEILSRHYEKDAQSRQTSTSQNSLCTCVPVLEKNPTDQALK